MRKKWTYVAVACMLLGTAPVFTGCIDTDEPAGLEDLRGAKSELLRAKAAVEAAKVAEVQAQAALLQAQAKVEEANAVKVQAEAEKIKAEAAIAQAKADYINAKTEKAKAEAQAVIDENNRIQAEWEAEAAVRQAEAEAAIKQAQLATAAALAKYQTVLAALQDTKNKALQPYIAKLETATDEYYNALYVLREAQRSYNEQSLKMEENEAYKELWTRGLQLEVNKKTATYEGNVAALEEAKATLEEAKTIKPHDLAVKLSEVVDKQNAIIKEVADLRIEAAEKMVTIYNEQTIPLLQKEEELSELKNAPQEIPAVSFDFGDGTGYPMYLIVNQGPQEYEELEYIYNSDQANYELRKKQLKDKLAEFKTWTRDDNDNEWTSERIAEYKGQAEALADEIETLTKGWQEAVNAYLTGTYDETDPSKISGYPGVETAVKNFNEAAADLNEANSTIATLVKAEEADRETRDAALTANRKAYTDAETAAKAQWQKDYPNAKNIQEERMEELEAELKDAMEDLEAAQKAYDDLMASGSSDADALLAALANLTAARNLVSVTNTAISNCTIGNIQAEIDKAMNDAIAEALKTKNTNDATANKTYNDKWGTDGTETKKLADARASIATLKDAVGDKVDALWDASVAFNNNISELRPIKYDLVYGLPDNKDKDGNIKAVTANEIIALSKAALEGVIRMRSTTLFGIDHTNNAYGDGNNYGQVLPMSDAEILAEVTETLAQKTEEGKPYNYHDYLALLRGYGKTGQRLACEEQVEIAESWLTNSELIQSKIDQAETALKALTDAHDALEASIEAKQEEIDLAKETLELAYAEVEEPAELKQLELAPLSKLYASIYNAIQGYISVGEEVWMSQEQIDQYIETCQSHVTNWEASVYEAETNLMQAKYNLEKWNQEDITTLEILATYVEDAQTEVDRKKAKLEEVQAALDAVIAALTNDPTASTEETPSTQE